MAEMGRREMQVDYVYDARGGRVCDHAGNPLWSRRDGIRVQAAHTDNGSMDARPFPATRLELEQFVQERVHQALYELDTRIENAVRRAIYGDPPDEDDVPVRPNAPDPGGETAEDEDDERVEAEIVTIPARAPHALTISFVHDGVKYHGTLYEVKENV